MRLMPSFLADKVSSLHAIYAVLAALFHRERTGQGQFVEVPMLEAFTSFMMVEHLYGETFEPSISHTGHTPALATDRRPLASKDGHIAIQPVSRAAAASTDVARYILRYDVIFPPMKDFDYFNSALHLGSFHDSDRRT